jgi:hypothetical protein
VGYKKNPPSFSTHFAHKVEREEKKGRKKKERKKPEGLSGFEHCHLCAFPVSWASVCCCRVYASQCISVSVLGMLQLLHERLVRSRARNYQISSKYPIFRDHNLKSSDGKEKREEKRENQIKKQQHQQHQQH